MTKNKKLKPEEIKDIRDRKDEPLTRLAKEYGVAPATILYHQKKTQKKEKKKPAKKVIKIELEKQKFTFSKKLKFEVTIDIVLKQDKEMECRIKSAGVTIQ